jgi:hypothetical protein
VELSKQAVDALESLGDDLIAASWQPKLPLAEGFEREASNPKRTKIILALAFLREYDAEIRSAICDGDRCKEGISASTTVVATIADTLSAIAGFPVPVANIANTLALYGVDRFCKIKKKT